MLLIGNLRVESGLHDLAVALPLIVNALTISPNVCSVLLSAPSDRLSQRLTVGLMLRHFDVSIAGVDDEPSAVGVWFDIVSF